MLWVASPAHPGPFLVRGRQLDGPRRLRFGEGPRPAAELLLPAGGTAHSQDSDWFNWPSYSRLRGGGCYAYQVDSANRHPDHRLPGMTPPRPLLPCMSLAWQPTVAGHSYRQFHDNRPQPLKDVSLATVIQAYRFALDPTPRQRRALASHCGAARVAHNWGLQLVRERLEQRRAGEEVEVPWALPALRREWNQAKDQVAPWWAENSKEAYSSGLDGLARALRNWSDSRTGRRKGRPVGFPRFKKKWRSRDACRFTTGQIKVLGDRKHVQLPRIGVLKTHESTRKLARRLEQGSARILSGTISRTADRWFVSFTVEVQRHLPGGNGKTTVVGVDVGVRQLAVLSNGTTIANPRALEDALRKLRRLNRQLARREPGSGRRKKTHRRLARVHARTANIRRDALHKLTSSLATEYGTVVVEHLNVGGMVRNRRLARAITDTGLAEIRRQLTYKTTWYGGRLVVADRFYPSSKTCSACGRVKAKLTLAERTFTCEDCGLQLDRDMNAAHNLAKLAQHVAQSGWETLNARGADRWTQLAGQVAMKREPSSVDIKTGTDG